MIDTDQSQYFLPITGKNSDKKFSFAFFQVKHNGLKMATIRRFDEIRTILIRTGLWLQCYKSRKTISAQEHDSSLVLVIYGNSKHVAHVSEEQAFSDFKIETALDRNYNGLKYQITNFTSHVRTI